MHTTKLREGEDSMMLAVPSVLLDQLLLRANSKISLALENKRLVEHPHPRLRHKLADLLAQSDT